MTIVGFVMLIAGLLIINLLGGPNAKKLNEFDHFGLVGFLLGGFLMLAGLLHWLWALLS